MKKKYEMMVAKMSSQDSTDEENTQTFYVIKAAQEKEELKRQGDELNQKIEKIEKSIRAAEATLDAISSHNGKYFSFSFFFRFFFSSVLINHCCCF